MGAQSAMMAEDKAEPINPLLEPVVINIEETLEAALGAEGGMDSDLVVQGKLEVTVVDDTKADLACIQLTDDTNPSDQSKFRYRLHPNMNKASHTSTNLLEIKDASKKFRRNAPAALLKWQHKTTDPKDEEKNIPISLTCWPSAEGNGSQMILEFEFRSTSVVKQLDNIMVKIPARGGQVRSTEIGEARMGGDQCLYWHIPTSSTSTNSSGTCEFFAAMDQDSMFPVQVTATAQSSSICPMELKKVYHQSSGADIKYLCSKKIDYNLTIGG